MCPCQSKRTLCPGCAACADLCKLFPLQTRQRFPNQRPCCPAQSMVELLVGRSTNWARTVLPVASTGLSHPGHSRALPPSGEVAPQVAPTLGHVPGWRNDRASALAHAMLQTQLWTHSRGMIWPGAKNFPELPAEYVTRVGPKQPEACANAGHARLSHNYHPNFLLSTHFPPAGGPRKSCHLHCRCHPGRVRYQRPGIRTAHTTITRRR